MDTNLWNYIFDQQPKMNPRLAEGIAVRQMEGPELRIDRVFRCAERLFPEGLTYDGWDQCTPEEELQYKIRRGTTKTLELSRSDVIMFKYKIGYKGRHLIDLPLYLPFCSDAGEIYLRGSRWTISPVIADRCLSVSKGSVFFPPLRDKVIFTQFAHQIFVDDRPTNVFVQKSKIHHFAQESDVKKLAGSVQGFHTLAHYLFCRYGLMETFQLHFECDPVFGDEQTVTPERYPVEDYVIVRSTGVKPKVLKNHHYQSTTLRVAVPRAQWNPSVESLLAGFFYVVDLFPERLTVEDIHHARLWRILFGVIIFGAGSGEGKVLEDFNTHLESLDDYVDEVTREDLHGSGVLVDDIYELFVHIIEQMPALLSNSDVANLTGKRLITWKYVLYDIIRSIFYLTYRLNPKGRKLQELDLRSAFQRSFQMEQIMKITSAGHPEVSNISSPSDSMITKFTSTAIPQAKAGNSKTGGDHDRTFADPSLHFHPSIMVHGSAYNQPKSNPGGASKLNPYSELGPNDEFVLREDLEIIINNVCEKISRSR